MRFQPCSLALSALLVLGPGCHGTASRPGPAASVPSEPSAASPVTPAPPSTPVEAEDDLVAARPDAFERGAPEVRRVPGRVGAQPQPVEVVVLRVHHDGVIPVLVERRRPEPPLAVRALARDDHRPETHEDGYAGGRLVLREEEPAEEGPARVEHDGPLGRSGGERLGVTPGDEPVGCRREPQPVGGEAFEDEPALRVGARLLRAGVGALEEQRLRACLHHRPEPSAGEIAVFDDAIFWTKVKVKEQT